MDMARKGIGGLLGTTLKVYKSSTAAAFRPRLTTDDSY
jgi:hypothetical protein